MKATSTALAGVTVVDIEPVGDERGFFARLWDPADFLAFGISSDLSQISVAYNEIAGTLRGLHFQAYPYEEAKTVRCTSGAIFDVAVDLRFESATLHKWVGIELSADNRRSLFVPEGCAHGYITLVDRTEVEYRISTAYNPEAARGYRWDDPTFAIDWPIPVRRISARDRTLPRYRKSGSAGP